LVFPHRLKSWPSEGVPRDFAVTADETGCADFGDPNVEGPLSPIEVSRPPCGKGLAPQILLSSKPMQMAREEREYADPTDVICAFQEHVWIRQPPLKVHSGQAGGVLCHSLWSETKLDETCWDFE
jgi:hypothetical protein